MRVEEFALGLTTPLETARGPIERREGFLVAFDPDAEAEDVADVPARGIGEATPLPGWTESLPACRAALSATEGTAAERLAAVDGDDAPAARHALSLAVADARARAAGRSLSATLADRVDLPAPAGSVPLNATVGDGDTESTAAAARDAAREGFPAVKVKAGARDLDADLARVRAVREAVGPDVAVRVDANGAWDRATAGRALDALGALDGPGVDYVEQPVPADDLSGLARLRRESGPGVSVAADEAVAAHGVDRVLAAEAADVLVCKPMALGGPDRALDAAVRARAADVDPVVTTTVDAVVARTAAVHVAAAIPDVRPCGLATGSLLAEDLAPSPVRIANGRATVPTDPGLAGDAFDGLAGGE